VKRLSLSCASPWFIKSIDFNAEQKQLNIHVDFKRGSTFADPDSEPAKMYKAYDTEEKSW